MNGYRRHVLPEGVIEAWAGGPCLVTGHRCPTWQVRRADGNGVQSRGRSREGSSEEVADEAERIARALLG